MTNTEMELSTFAGPRPMRVRVEGPPGTLAGEERRPTVLVLHGFKGFMHWGFFPLLSRRIAEAGYVCVSFNFSGSGIGEDLLNFTDPAAFENDTTSRQLEDVAALREALGGTGFPSVDPERVAILGHSRGGGVALIHAAERGDYRAVVTWAAIDDVDRFGPEAVEMWRAQGFLPIENARTGQVFKLDIAALHDAEQNRERLDILAACRRLRTPTLVIHGTEDASVDYAGAVRIAQALPAGSRELVTLEGAGHTFGAVHPLDGEPADLERALEATLGHLREHLGTQG